MYLPVWAIVFFLCLLVMLAGYVGLRFRNAMRAAELFRSVAEGASDGLVLMERDSRIVWTNEAYSRIMGYAHGELVGRYPLRFALPDRLALPEDEISAFRFNENEQRFGMLTQVENVRKNGTEFVHEFSHAALRVGNKPLFLLAGRDITDRLEREKALIAAQEKLEHQSRTDALTGLSNRGHMQTVLDGLVELRNPFAVLQIDVNRMKHINDTFGHLAGDAALLNVARAIQENLEANWLGARVGGDEFIVLMPDVLALEDAESIGRLVAADASKAFLWKSVKLTPEISVGAAIWDRAVGSADDLLNRSDIALYEAKRLKATDVVGYDDALSRKSADEQALERDLVHAMKHKLFTFHFQPIFNIETRKVEKFEMLARWKHEERGFIPPDRFLPLLEQVGLTGEFDRHVAFCAERALSRLDSAGLADVGLSINLCADAFSTPSMTELLAWLVECGRLDPFRVSLEVLEGTALTLAADNLQSRLLSLLRDLGFRIFLDDFGMGYAGLAHLASLPCTGLKIDRGLTSAVDTDGASRAIVTTLIKLARELELDVVTEGVENTAQMEVVHRAGCPVFQGYAIARPMPLNRAVSWALFDDGERTGTRG